MQIVVIKHTGYDVGYIKRMNIFSFLDLWEIAKKISKHEERK